MNIFKLKTYKDCLTSVRWQDSIRMLQIPGNLGKKSDADSKHRHLDKKKSLYCRVVVI